MSFRMVDVSGKFETKRFARASGRIRLPKEVVDLIREGRVKKGDVLRASEIAGMMGAKRTFELLPFCHPIPFDAVEVRAELEEDGVRVEATVSGVWRTGYEMEAVTAVVVALTNVYDMCKAYTGEMVIEDVRVVEKGGGKSDWYDDLSGLRVAIIVVSDSVYEGKREDRSGKALRRMCEELGAKVVWERVVPDEVDAIKGAIEEASGVADLILTTGGTGASLRDVTPEASQDLLVKEMPGLAEAMRILGVRFTPRTLLSRAKAGIVKEGCVLINLPGSVRGATESLSMVAPLIKHLIEMSRGGGHE